MMRRLPMRSRQQTLADRVVDLVRAGVTEVLALQVDPRAAEPPRQVLGEVERRRAADVLLQAVAQLGWNARSRRRLRGRPPRARAAPASASRRRSARRTAEVPAAVRHAWHCDELPHQLGVLAPGALSTPLATSTPYGAHRAHGLGDVVRVAARRPGTDAPAPRRRRGCQSKLRPLPPCCPPTSASSRMKSTA